jgi:hypothetical protein
MRTHWNRPSCWNYLFGLLVCWTFNSVSTVCAQQPSLVRETWSIADASLHEDFPALCVDAQATPWLAYVQYDGTADELKIARKSGDGLKVIGSLAGPGIIHQPALASDGEGRLWTIWSQVDEASNTWRLKARAVIDGKIQAKVTTLESDSGSAVFSEAATDPQGRVWVVWQSFRGGLADIFAKYYDPAKDRWSDEIQVTKNPAGDWEPRLVFGPDGQAVVIFDSSRGGAFNIYMAQVGLNGKSVVKPLTDSARHQARPSVAATLDGAGLWLAWENGQDRWGRNTRGVENATGLNFGKGVEVAYYDFAAGTTTPAANVTPALLDKPSQKAAKAAAKAPKKKPARRQPGRGVQAINLPEIFVDADGNPWLTARFYGGPCYLTTKFATNWRVAATRYDPVKRVWTQPQTLANSSYGQDRHCRSCRDSNGQVWLSWPSDQRQTKKALVSGVYLAKLDAAAKLPTAAVAASKPKAKATAARWGDDTPERTRAERHRWSAGDAEYGLYWGDFHRHTDVSNCRTPNDGCIVEQFRYAYDLGGLDFLGTSDHTDIGKPYDPYEWWCNQKLMDVFYAPGFFNSFYVYEREQPWPWGHRNVVFAERGGPIVYINRGLYQASPWNKQLPVGDGGKAILPEELWALLKKDGRAVTVISHTGATGMGTDWNGYNKIDSALENLVEIYQGARVSYEGKSTPQPTVGFPEKGKLKPDEHGSVKTGRDFGKFNNGVYQNALSNGHKLGVFASSDHISTNTSYGGVYAKSFTRKGILEGLQNRRTVAATDKIFMEFSCNGHLLGDVFETSKKPTLKIAVRGTAPLSVVTVVRNEVNYREFTSKKRADFEVSFTDDEPLVGENRYYLRVQQTDGNMGWTSPVWVTYKK